jgi:hypothetical protein
MENFVTMRSAGQTMDDGWRIINKKVLLSDKNSAGYGEAKTYLRRKGKIMEGTKKMRGIRIPALLILCGLSVCAKAEYKPVEGKIMSRWAKEVTPDNVLGEYPRPQMVRKDWQNLNGLWDYAIVSKDSDRPGQFDGRILVPFAVESALSGVGKAVGPDNKLWYRRTFEIHPNWKNKTILLHFGAVDWNCDVWVNGKHSGSHKGGYDPFSFDITSALKPAGPQEIIVSVWDPVDTGKQPRGKQVLRPEGIMYTSVTGIWQTVWLEPTPATRIGNIKITPDVDNQKLTVVVDVQGETAGLSYGADAKASGFSASASSTENTLTLDIKNPKLWSPDSPFLYDLKVQIKKDGKVIDQIDSYFGMRKISIGKDDKGIVRIMLNNQFLFEYGPLDQGWWPDGLYTAPTDEALKSDVQLLKDIGMNMLRKHVKVEPARFYTWCDKLGILVWQDMPSGDKGIGGNDPDLKRTPESAQQFELEWKNIIQAFCNYPCIVMWVPFNEGWGQYDTARIVTMTQALDPTRLVNNASGWTDRGVGHVHDMHNYPGPGMFPVEEGRAEVLGEFGGLGLPVSGHTWQEEKNWGYKSYKNSQDLTGAYVDLMFKLRPLIAQGLNAAVYTQTSDVEIEVNGLLTYDRAVFKMDKNSLIEAHKKLYLQTPKINVLAATSQTQAQEWRYTTLAPAQDWFKPGFDDSAWKTGRGGFGTQGTLGAVVGTEWNTDQIWIRRTVQLADNPTGEAALMVHHDEDAKVYINGVPAAEMDGFTVGYGIVRVDPAAAKTLKKGPNTIAIACKQTSGGQYIDAGLVEMVEQN